MNKNIVEKLEYMIKIVAITIEYNPKTNLFTINIGCGRKAHDESLQDLIEDAYEWIDLPLGEFPEEKSKGATT